MGTGCITWKLKNMRIRIPRLINFVDNLIVSQSTNWLLYLQVERNFCWKVHLPAQYLIITVWNFIARRKAYLMTWSNTMLNLVVVVGHNVPFFRWWRGRCDSCDVCLYAKFVCMFVYLCRHIRHIALLSFKRPKYIYF